MRRAGVSDEMNAAFFGGMGGRAPASSVKSAGPVAAAAATEAAPEAPPAVEKAIYKIKIIGIAELL